MLISLRAPYASGALANPCAYPLGGVSGHHTPLGGLGRPTIDLETARRTAPTTRSVASLSIEDKTDRRGKRKRDLGVREAEAGTQHRLMANGDKNRERAVASDEEGVRGGIADVPTHAGKQL